MMMSNTVRSAAAVASVTMATVALASGDSGTGSVGEMPVTGGMIGMILGGVVAMGIVIWVLVKFLNK